MIVVDASVIADALLDPDSAEAAAMSVQSQLVVPAILARLEVLDAIRQNSLRRGATGMLERAERMLSKLPLEERAGINLARVWELRDNVRPYDAVYVALAERLDVPLLTNDRRLVKVPGPRCAFQFVA